MGIAPNLKSNIYGNSSDSSQGHMTSNMITIGIKGSGTVAAAPVRIYEEKGNHILTFVIEVCAICICLIYISILIAVTVLC